MQMDFTSLFDVFSSPTGDSIPLTDFSDHDGTSSDPGLQDALQFSRSNLTPSPSDGSSPEDLPDIYATIKQEAARQEALMYSQFPLQVALKEEVREPDSLSSSEGTHCSSPDREEMTPAPQPLSSAPQSHPTTAAGYPTQLPTQMPPLLPFGYHPYFGFPPQGSYIPFPATTMHQMPSPAAQIPGSTYPVNLPAATAPHYISSGFKVEPTHSAAAYPSPITTPQVWTLPQKQIPSQSGKSRRIRTDFTPSQLQALEVQYQKCIFCRGIERDNIAADLGVPPKSVTIWFQNRRARTRNDEKQERILKTAATTGTTDLSALQMATSELSRLQAVILQENAELVTSVKSEFI